MKHATQILLTIALALFSQARIAGENDCSDKPECWPEGSAMSVGLLTRQAQELERKLLEQRHQELVSLLSEKVVRDGREYSQDQRLIEAVKDQHEAWSQYIGHECEMIGSLSLGASPWQSVRSTTCAANLTSQRLRRVRHAVRCIRRIVEKDPYLIRVEQNACLYQLAPMAIPLEK